MKKTILLVIALTPLWLCAQHKVIELTPASGSVLRYVLSSISKQTFQSGQLVTRFIDGTGTVATSLHL